MTNSEYQSQGFRWSPSYNYLFPLDDAGNGVPRAVGQSDSALLARLQVPWVVNKEAALLGIIDRCVFATDFDRSTRQSSTAHMITYSLANVENQIPTILVFRVLSTAYIAKGRGRRT